MRYQEIINEGLTATSLDGRSVPILKNPSPNVLVDRVRRTRGLRGIVDDGDCFWANSYALIHVQIGKAIGASDGYGDARLELRWRDGAAVLTIFPNRFSFDQINALPQIQRLLTYLPTVNPASKSR